MIQDHEFHAAPKAGQAGFQMIRSIDVRNFRCYRHLQLDRVSRLNVLVGDNGSGKTTLLESIFLPLATGTEVGVRMRQQRGMDGMLGGSARRIEEALWVDLFHNHNMKRAISLSVEGDGAENRSLKISRGEPNIVLPLGEDGKSSEPIVSAPVVFTWTDSSRQPHSVVPKFASGNLTLPDTGEDMPDFFLIPSNAIIGSVENAGRFSELSRLNKHKKFISVFTKEYDWIEDINIEVHGGAPVLFASVKGGGGKIPVPNISSGINRAMSVMLAISSRPKSIVLVDEIENGLYYKHMESYWRSILSFLRENESQLFVSTHSRECLEALARAAGKNFDDIALWQAERGEEGHTVQQFMGDEFRLALEYHSELR